MRYFYLLLLSFCLLQAEDTFDIGKSEITLSAECEPLTCVADCVNVQSGQFFQVEHDFIGNTIDPLQLVRFYDSGSSAESFLGSGFGSQYPLFASSIQDSGDGCYAMISERDGFLLPYRSKKKKFEIDSRLFKKGYTNYKSGNSNTNMALRQASYDAYRINQHWSLELGNGARRVYGKPIEMNSATIRILEFPTRHGFLLTEEKKANGNIVRYEYETKNSKPLLSKITTFNKTGDVALNSVEFEHSENGCKLKSSCGKSIDYAQQSHLCMKGIGGEYRQVLNKVNFDADNWIVYETGDCNPDKKKFSRVAMVKKPNGYYQRINYDSKDRVARLVEPSGEHGHGVTSHSFEYLKNCTNVYDTNGQKTAYNFDANKRISSIDTYDQNKLIKQEVFEWDTESDQRGWLKSKSLRLGDYVYHTTSYAYDENGNVTKETLTGIISGEGSEYFFAGRQGHAQTYSTEYEYSKDGRNLLLSKKTPEGLTTSYEYENDRNLITKKLVSYQGSIQERLFCFYDDNGQIEKIVEDDGSKASMNDLSGVTYRKTKKISSVKQPGAYFGKPESIEQSIGKEQKLQKRIEFLYDNRGNEITQKHFDSKLNLCYETHRDYDQKNRIIATTDALGQITQFAYDCNDNKIEETVEGSGKSIHYGYDCMYRLANKTERHENGEVFVTTYKYNNLNQLVSAIDCYNNETTYFYDRLGKLIEVRNPTTFNDNGEAVFSTLTKKYNILGLVEETDESGGKTTYRNNIYGKPAHVMYPDNHQEWNTYNPSGTLNHKKYADGSYRKYEYDAKGHLLQESLYDQKNTLLSNDSYTYKGKFLTSFTNSLGTKTTYEYDSAGRKVKETCGGKLTQYHYDSFDRVNETIQGSAANKKHEVLTYDWLDRITSKTHKDSEGKLFSQETYEYDRQGNQNLFIKHIDDVKQASYNAEFNSDGSLSAKVDPLNNKQEWQHDHHFTNKSGQVVPTKRIIDPLGRHALEEKDAHGRLSKRSNFENDQLFSVTSFSYDAAGNEVKQMTQVTSQNVPLREYGVVSTYNKQNLIASQTEIPANKTTRFEYNFRGQLIKKEKPDGVIISYTHDSLGRVLTMNASDGSISYDFKYDLHAGPIEIRDNVHQTVQKREYDKFDRLVREEFTPSTVLQFTYDGFDRLTKMILPDNSTIVYEYNPFRLKKIKRTTSSGSSYEIECTHYDKCGNLLQLKNPSGKIQYSYDLLNRPENIYAHNWTSNHAFDPIGNLKKVKQYDLEGHQDKEMAYDRLNYIIKDPTHDYVYDSIGNCISKNGYPFEINTLNQLTKDDLSEYRYDLNGNLIAQSCPPVTYKYDALNRLTVFSSENSTIKFTYDAFGRLLSTKPLQQFLYQSNQEIGSLVNGKLTEFRVVHPDPVQDKTFAIELQGQVYFPVQDLSGNICALKNKSGQVVKSYRYSAFGEESSSGSELESPWRFANRRQIEGMTLFTHRFYNPKMMRWLTPDPAGFAQNLNLYTYNRNNPYYYTDPDGRFALPLIWGAIVGAEIVIEYATLNYLACGCLFGGIVYTAHKIDEKLDNNARMAANEANALEEENKKAEQKKAEEAKTRKPLKKPNNVRGGAPRDDLTSNYTPDAAADGNCHSTFGIRKGKTKNGVRTPDMLQGATFVNDEFVIRVDLGDHGQRSHPPVTGIMLTALTLQIQLLGLLERNFVLIYQYRILNNSTLNKSNVVRY